MDRELNRLTATAQKIEARISPRRDPEGHHITLSDEDAIRIVSAVRHLSNPSLETTFILRTVTGPGGAPWSRTLTVEEVLRLSAAFERLASDAERARRIERGQYVGPMSGSEAVKFMRGRGRRGF